MTDVIEKPKTKLSVIPPGHWRCWFRLLTPADWVDYVAACGCAYHSDGRALDCKRHISRDIADTWAAQVVGPYLCKYAYIEAEFFPGEAP